MFLILFAAYFILVRIFSPFHQFEFDLDEGRNLAKAALALKGYSLYSTVWSDQPPIMTWMLELLMRITGPSVEAARGLVLGFCALMVACFFSIMDRRYGRSPALLSTFLLITSRWFLRLSVSIMIGMVSLSFLFLSLELLDRAKESSSSEPASRRLAMLSGVASCLSCATKLITAPWIPLIFWNASARRRDWIRGYATVFVPIALFCGPQAFRQLLYPHVQATWTDSSNPVRAWFYIQTAPVLSVTALFAVCRPDFFKDLKQKSGFLWAALGLGMIFTIRPFQYHYFPFAATGLAWLSASFFEAVFRKLQALPNLKSTYRQLVFAAIVFIVLAPAVSLREGLHVFPPLNERPVPIDALHETEIQKTIADAAQKFPWIFTDWPILAFRQPNVQLIPTSAVLSRKRLFFEWNQDRLHATILREALAQHPDLQVALVRFPPSAELEGFLSRCFIQTARIPYQLSMYRHFVSRGIAGCS